MSIRGVSTDTDLLTNSRSLQNQWRAECPATYNHELPSLVNFRSVLVRMKRLGRHNLHPCGSSVFDNYFVTLGVAHQMEVLVVSPSTMNVSVSRVRSTTGIPMMVSAVQLSPGFYVDKPIDPLEPMLGPMACYEVLQVISRWNSL